MVCIKLDYLLMENLRQLLLMIISLASKELMSTILQDLPILKFGLY